MPNWESVAKNEPRPKQLMIEPTLTKKFIQEITINFNVRWRP